MSSPYLFSTAEPDAVRAEWQALAERTSASPFLHPGWVEAWWRAFGRGTLELHCARSSGRLAALLPVRRASRALASLTNWHTPEASVLAESDEALLALWSAVLATRPRRVALAFLAPQQAELLQREAARAGFAVIRRTLQLSPFVALDGEHSAYEKRLGKNLRGDLARRHRRLTGRGRVAFEVSTELGTQGELEALLAQGFAVEGSGWKGAHGTAIASRPATMAFYGRSTALPSSPRRAGIRISRRIVGRMSTDRSGCRESRAPTTAPANTIGISCTARCAPPWSPAAP